ncbi:MAG: MoaD family protein [Candidatus Bathyarchaeota archaeon]|jgi:molybdopterin synthase sulfur carrier subunit|nr:MoaD family protein [Candidatus Bathyarchaeota archaeon]
MKEVTERMVTIQVLTFSRITQIIGKKRFVIEAENIEGLLSTLVSLYGISLKQELYDDDGQFKSLYRIIVNGRNINLLKGFQTVLHENDIVVIMPAIAGG